jgi:exopolyphosphatase/pppGpp-phosphohydrolase
MKVTILDGNESPGDASIVYKEYIKENSSTKVTSKFVKQSRGYGGQQKEKEIIYSRERRQGVSENEVDQRRHHGEKVDQGLDIDVILNKEDNITRETLKEMRDDIVLWIKDTKESIKCLRELADEIEDIFKSWFILKLL